MNCRECRVKIHDFLDGDLPVVEADALDRHLQKCVECRELYDDLRWTKQAISTRLHLTEFSQEQLWAHIHEDARRTFRTRLLENCDRFYTFWRDIEPRTVWSKLSAVPVTVLFFILLMAQFSPLDMQSWSYTALSFLHPSRPVVTEIYARHTQAEITGLMSTAWKLPFEDSLSLVAEITPEGHAQIEDVLQYPKSRDLLNAVDSTLRNSEFQTHGSNSLVLVTFQKIDVYEDQQRGL